MNLFRELRTEIGVGIYYYWFIINHIPAPTEKKISENKQNLKRCIDLPLFSMKKVILVKGRPYPEWNSWKNSGFPFLQYEIWHKKKKSPFRVSK